MKKAGLLALSVLVVFAARGEWLSEAAVRRAAEAFPTRSFAGSSVLPGRQLASLEARGRLWVARYSPTGYAVFAGSDLAGPVIAFAATDFAEPVAGSAFFDVLAGASAGCERVEAAGESENGLRIRAKWAKLASSRPLLGAAEAGSGTITAYPFLTTSWSQYQPYNDYAPVYTTEADDDSPYRGRVPCGCVATAAAQVFAYWRWPARIDAVRTYDHDFTKANGTVGTYTIRFDGHVPFGWDSLANEYPIYNEATYEFDMRGAVAESTRYPVARLVSLCDSLAQMDFAPDASSSNYDTLIANTPWYEGGTKYSTSSDRAAAKAAAKADIEAGIPVLVSIPGHAVVGHGWMEEDDTSYIYFNYGWGGENDGYYNFDDQSSENNAVMAVYTGFRPRFTAQLDPLPAVLPSSTTLRWHVPDCWTNSIEGFAVTVQTVYPSEIETSPDASAWLSGVSSSDGMRIDGQSRLAITTRAVGTYTMSGVYLLTARSELTFGVASSYAFGMSVTVEASFDGGPWAVLSEPSLSENGESGRSVCRAYLGEHGGQMARFRVRAARTSSQFYPMDFAGVWLDSLCVSGTCRKASSTVVVHDANARSFDLGAFTGCGVVVSVTPVGTGAEMSDFVTAWGEGESLVPDPGQETYVATGGGGSEPVLPEATFSSVTRTACAAPEILSVSSTPGIAEGFFGECSVSGNVISVTCSGSTTALTARPAALSVLPDSAVTVHSLGGGSFAVVIDASGLPSYADRTRTILTLGASNANGTTVYKDLSLRFSAETEGEEYVAVSAVTVEDGAITLAIPYSWFVDEGLVASGADASAYEAAAAADSDGDGAENWKEYLCGTDPNDATKFLMATIRMVNDEAVVGHNLDETELAEKGFRAVVQGKVQLTDGWSARTTGHRFFRVVVEPAP